MTTTPLTHVYFLLDRSGSMESIASDVIGGFNQFLDEQRQNGDDALMTFVQFDSNNPHEVIANAMALSDVRPLTGATFRPRGSTPLFDAMGSLITDATIRSEGEGKGEVIIFVTFTDGKENDSVNYTRESIFELVAKREALGWTFVYLGANQDSYAEGAGMGYHADNLQDFEASPKGTRLAFQSLSKGLGKERGKIREGVARSTSEFFEGDKEAETDLRRPY